MSFRTSDKLRGYQLPLFLPENKNYQKKTGYKLTITDTSSLFDYFYGYFEVSKELQKADGSGDGISIINRGRPLIKRMVIKSAGKILYDSDIGDIHRIVDPKKMLEYEDAFRSLMLEKTLFCVYRGEDPDFKKRDPYCKITKNGKIIPLYRYSFFEELKNKMLPPMQLTFELDLNDEDEMFHKEAAYDGLVVVTRLYLCIPIMIPKDGMYDEFVKDCYIE